MNWLLDQPLFVVFPHQLFSKIPDGIINVALVEEELFFARYRFHKQKLVYHRASMQYYADYLKKRKLRVNYFESKGKAISISALIQNWTEKGVNRLQCYRLEDDWLMRRLNNAASASGIQIQLFDTPQFLLSSQQVTDYFKEKSRFLQANFYSSQRRRLNILMNAGKPQGDKWSFDEQNRLRFPASRVAPALPLCMNKEDQKYLSEAQDYVTSYFPESLGELVGSLQYPVTHDGANRWLNVFLQQRLNGFGSYEDAMVAKEPVLHHSLFSVFLNNGLLQPEEVLNAVLKTGKENAVGLNDMEGFVRQLLGWREFVRGVYIVAGSKQRTKNYWGFKRSIPASFYTGTTGIVPVDTVIKKVLQNGYCHHIERLMVLSNFMLLCEFDPDEVYRWFMELFIDAYDWVMVPNIYGMGQFADGGLMSTKPYISGSNYLLKMGDFQKGGWTEVWDALYWRFIHLHRDFFLKNPRMGVMVKSFDRMSIEKKATLLHRAEQYITSLHSV